MSRNRKILIGVIVAAVLGTAGAMSVRAGGKKGISVRMAEVERRDLVATVTASGNVRARQSVDISSDVVGRIISLVVEEGDDVVEGQVLLRIDPTQHQAQLSRARANFSQSQAGLAQQQASLVQAERESRRMSDLWERDSSLVSRQQVDDAQTNLEVARATHQSAQYIVEQSQASVAEVQDQLSKTVIRAPITGKVTRLSVEQGETVVVGTMNNPGSLLLTISDLSVMEAVMEIDETDIPEISLGDTALVDLDAFPDIQFNGVVTEIGNSAIRPPSSLGAGQTATIDFEVVITLIDPEVVLRPDLSATADIVIETAEEAISVPIIALTVKEPDDDEAADSDDEEEKSSSEDDSPLARRRVVELIEGVYKVADGKVTFVPVEVGIAGQEYFEIKSGIAEGDTVVSGPYTIIRTLEDGDEVTKRGGGGEGS